MEKYPSPAINNMLVAVDVQHDFIDGSLAVNEGDEVVAPINTLAEAVRETNGQVAFTRDWHPATTPHFDAWPVHCVADTLGATFADDLDIREDDTIISKGMGQTDGYSGIEGVAEDGSTLESLIETQLERSQKVQVFIGGLATDYCVKATSIDLATRFANTPDVTIYAIREAMRAVNIQPNDEVDAVKAIADAGVHVTSLQDALAIIDQGRME